MIALHDPILAVLRAAVFDRGRVRDSLATVMPVPELAGTSARFPGDTAGLPPRLRKRLPEGVVRLGANARVLSAPAASFAGSRVALLAQWAEDGNVAPYVRHYIRSLKAEGWRVVLACGNEPTLPPSLVRECDAIVCRNCPGYDFTSWKAALEVFPSLWEAEELLLTNDSIFAPIGPLGPVHTAMQGVACDFWGMVGSKEFLTHLQSYYLVFRGRALRHPAFAAFWDAVGGGDKADAVLNREVVLTAWLAWNGLVPGAYAPPGLLLDTDINPAHYFWRELCCLCHVPFIKRDLLRDCRFHPHLNGWEDFVRRSGYDLRLIANAF